ncbi:MAG: hypothetical protein AB1797_00900 [bacterium]
MTWIKICGITRIEDALAVVEAGADALGFIFAKSPRRIELSQAVRIAEKLPPLVSLVGVFLDQGAQEIQKVIASCPLTALQFHGQESPEFCRAGRKREDCFPKRDTQRCPHLEQLQL